MADLSGGGSGLLARDSKGKNAARLVTRIDPGVVAMVNELRSLERRAAEELEEWKTRVKERKPLDASPAVEGARPPGVGRVEGGRRGPRLCANRHRARIPVAHPLLEVAGIGQQCRAGRTEAEHGIFHRPLTAAHRLIENAVVLLVGVISRWGREPRRFDFRGGLAPRRILLPILAQKLLLDGLRESVDAVPWLALRWRLFQR
jgi:hypothetical protein